MFRSFQVFCCVLCLGILMLGCSRLRGTGIEGDCRIENFPGPKDAKRRAPKPGIDVIIKLKAVDSETTLFEGRTDAYGRFRIAAKPGKYRLVAEIPSTTHFAKLMIQTQKSGRSSPMKTGELIEVVEGAYTKLDFRIDAIAD